MIDYEFAIRTAAVVAAAALVAAPGVVAQAKEAVAWLNSWRGGEAKRRPVAGPDDAFTVVEMARRLQAAGNKRGVELCQQLLDVLLQPEPQRK
jgi:hypothetical protein